MARARDSAGRFLPKGVQFGSPNKGGARVEGVSAVLKRLGKVKIGLGKQLERGLVKAGLFLQRESQKIVPVDTAALKNTAFTRKEGKLLDTEVMVGYTQSYAIIVHEDLNAKHKPGKTAKYLERPARENQAKLGQIIADEMKKTK